MAVEGGTIHDATREMLLRERASLVARMRAITQDALNLEFEQDGVPPSGYEREQALTSLLDGRLCDIDNALARIERGTYGTCDGCSQQIPPRRLEALPFAILCVQCQGAADKKAARRRV